QQARSAAGKQNNNDKFSRVNETTSHIPDDTNNDGAVDVGETVMQKSVTDVASETKTFFWSPPFSCTPDGTTIGGSTEGNWVAVVHAQWEWKWVQMSRPGRITLV